MWIIGTSDGCYLPLFAKIGIQSGVVSTLDVIRLNMTCGAANGYLCLSLCCEKRLEVIFGMLGVHCLN